jgi:hypothetical protein
MICFIQVMVGTLSCSLISYTNPLIIAMLDNSTDAAPTYLLDAYACSTSNKY